MGNPTTHAEALHQAGRRAEAGAQFVGAEAAQAKRQPEYPRLYSLQGFRYCDLLLADAERAAWRRLVLDGDDTLGAFGTLIEVCCAVSSRTEGTLKWAELTRVASLLDLGLDHLTLARATLYQAILSGETPTGEHVKEAVDFLRRAGQVDHLSQGLSTGILFRATTGAFDGAREDLDEAFEIAERGPLRLILADIHLHRARLFGLLANRPAEYPWVSARDDLDKARKLIDECGYGRRREELADAEAAWKRIYRNVGSQG